MADHRLIKAISIISLAFTSSIYAGPNLIINPSGEAPPLTMGWSGDDWELRTEQPSPLEGSSYFYGGAQNADPIEKKLSQIIDVGIADGKSYDFYGFISGWDHNDAVRIELEFLDANQNILGSNYSTGNKTNEKLWELIRTRITAPSNTRFIRVNLLSIYDKGSNNDGYIDGLILVEAPSSTLYGSNLIVNPSAGSDILNSSDPNWTGWRSDDNPNWYQRSANPSPKNVTPGEDESYFAAGATAANIPIILYQDIDLDLYQQNIDNQTQEFVYGGYVSGYNSNDLAQIKFEFWDSYPITASSSLLADAATDEKTSTRTWLPLSGKLTPPTGTRAIRVNLVSTKHNGNNNDGYYDELVLEALEPESVEPQHDLQISALNAPATVSLEAPIAMSVTVRNIGDFAESSQLTITNATTNELLQTTDVSLDIGEESSVSINYDTSALAAGSYDFQWQLEAVEGEISVANNSLENTVLITSGESAQVVINEVLYDVSGTDMGKEWIELLNVSPEPADISSWSLVWGDNSKLTDYQFPSGTIIPANGYLLMGPSSVLNSVADNPNELIKIVKTDLAFHNGRNYKSSYGTDGIWLKDLSATTVDALLYDGSNYDRLSNEDESRMMPSDHAAVHAHANESLARVPNGVDNDIPSLDFAPIHASLRTPGQENQGSTTPPLTIAAFVQDTMYQTEQEKNNYEGQAIALINTSNSTIELADFGITDFDPDINSVAWFPSRPLQPNETIWITRNNDVFYRYNGFNADYDVLATTGSSAISGAELMLTTNDELAVVKRNGSSFDKVDAVRMGNGNTSGSLSSADWKSSGLQAYAYIPEDRKLGSMQMRKQRFGYFVDTNDRNDWLSETDLETFAGLGMRPYRQGWKVQKTLAGPYKFSQHSSIEILISPDNTYERVIELIASAQNSIYIKTYLFDSLGVTQAIVSALNSNPNLDVQVLMDRGPNSIVKSDAATRHAAKLISDAGGKFYYTDVPLKNSDMVEEEPNRYHLIHEKTLIIDDLKVMWGSGNFNNTSMPADDKTDSFTSGNREVFAISDSSELISHLTQSFFEDVYLDSNHQELHYDVYEYPAGPSGPDENLWNTGDGQLTSANGSHCSPSAIRFPNPAVFPAEDISYEVILVPENSLQPGSGLLSVLNEAGNHPGDEVLVQENRIDPWRKTFSLSRKERYNSRLQSYIDAARRGADVKVAIHNQSDSIFDTEVRSYINDLAVREDLPNIVAKITRVGTCSLHNKMLLIKAGPETDKKHYSVIGSLNGHDNGYKRTRELAVIIESEAVYNYLKGMFDSDWEQ